MAATTCGTLGSLLADRQQAPSPPPYGATNCAGPLSAAQFWLMCRAVTKDDVAQRRAQRKVATSLRSSR